MRTDPHRPGAIVPAEYVYLFSYDRGTNEEPPCGCEAFALLPARTRWGGPTAETGVNDQCTVCRTRYRFGDVWRHTPTGEHILVGHQCAAKYGLLADYSAFELEMGRAKAARAAELQKQINARKFDTFCAKHEGLAEALDLDHHTSQDLAAKLRRFHDLSEKQIALALKLLAESRRPAAEQEKTVAAPASNERQTFRGLVISAKRIEGQLGTAFKMTVKVITPEGVWLAWGTMPQGLFDQIPDGATGKLQRIRGAEVEVTAKLKAGRDPHFAIMSRPRAKLLKLYEVVQ